MRKKYSVILESWGNIDYRQDPNAPVYGVPNKIIQVDTLEEASQKVREYIEEYELKAGNCIGGCVFEGTKQIASISYNGRIWENGSEYYHIYNEDY